MITLTFNAFTLYTFGIWIFGMLTGYVLTRKPK